MDKTYNDSEVLLILQQLYATQVSDLYFIAVNTIYFTVVYSEN